VRLTLFGLSASWRCLTLSFSSGFEIFGSDEYFEVYIRRHATSPPGAEISLTNWSVQRGQMRLLIQPNKEDRISLTSFDQIWNITVANPIFGEDVMRSGVAVKIDIVDFHGHGHIECESFECYNSVFFEDAHLNAIARTHNFTLNQLQHTLVNLTGFNVSFPAEDICIYSNALESSTIFVDSDNNIRAHYNGFDHSGRTQAGLDLPPIMNLYLNSLESLETRLHTARIARGLIDARGNFWGHDSGPSTCCNPGGKGTPLLWITEFSNWCLDYECKNFSSGSADIRALLQNQSWSNMPTCYYESFCAPQDQTVLWTVVGVEIGLALLCIAICTFFFLQEYLSPFEKWKKMVYAVRLAAIRLV
jgi:hypothetical protein